MLGRWREIRRLRYAAGGVVEKDACVVIGEGSVDGCVIDAAIIRCPRRDDVLVLRVPEGTAPEAACEIRDDVAQRIGCKVIVIMGAGIELVSFTGDVA